MSLAMLLDSANKNGPETPLERCPALTETMLEHRMADDRYSAEEWCAIKNYPDYEVSSFGRVRSYRRAKIEKILKPGRGRNGYLHVSIFNDQGVRQFKVSRLVCEAFNGPPTQADMQAAHGDGDVTNNRATNLRWATVAENAQDRARHGTQCRGETHGKSKVNTEVVQAIRTSSEPYDVIARKFGISRSNVSQIRRRIAWSHVK